MTQISVNQDLPCDAVLNLLAKQPTVWIRVTAVLESDGTWSARLLDLVSGAPPPAWTNRTLEYPTAVFHAVTLTGLQAVEALRRQTLAVAGRSVTLSQPTTRSQPLRRQSHETGIYEALEWPSTEFLLASSATLRADPMGHMVSESAPSFLSYYAAVADFFQLARTPLGTVISQNTVYRYQDVRGRIESVTHLVATGTLQVTIKGRAADLTSMTLELAGDSPGPYERLADVSESNSNMTAVTFTLPGGLPPGSWLLLKRGSEWIDRRFLSVPYTRGDDAGITIVINPADRLESLIGRRERETVEFKQQISRSLDSRRRLMKTVCAFANGNGGSILIGVTDDRDIVGIPPAAVDSIRDQLTQIVNIWVYPRPPITFELLDIAGSNNVVLELMVGTGSELCGSGPPGETKIPYIRIGGVSERASTADITRIVQERTTGRLNTPPP